MNATARIATMRPEHAEQVLKVHQLGIDTGHATFETGAPTWAEFDAARLPEPRFVALDHAAGIWTVQSGVLPENTASPALTRVPPRPHHGSPPVNPSRQACDRRPGWSGTQTGAQARTPGRARRVP
ncbi:hypothetical protein [Streptomyces sp. NRRL B-24572]|uniref:hypothetical protein n=1 Tax=Streptomyces sp. NRRL B-24572 TaxID=1962156 RepID=UPI00211B1613|nr:hypothetical protein [Streptomyces sp. NRRL B-24572]